MHRVGRKNAGFSLIEVIIATGLLAVIALTIVGLFIHGRKDIASGQYMTTALATCQHVTEDLDALSYVNLYKSWDLGGGPVADTSKRATILIHNVAGWQIKFEASSPAYAGETAATSDTAFDTLTAPATPANPLPPATVLQPVRTQAGVWIKDLDRLPNSSLRIVLTPLFDMNDSPAPPEPGNTALFEAAVFIRMDVTVSWIEQGTRRRSVTLPQIRTLNDL